TPWRPLFPSGKKEKETKTTTTKCTLDCLQSLLSIYRVGSVGVSRFSELKNRDDHGTSRFRHQPPTTYLPPPRLNVATQTPWQRGNREESDQGT
ncbi:hypothetical protein SKAU_G00191260, partial [Synaphobranchus kaupii]